MPSAIFAFLSLSVACHASSLSEVGSATVAADMEYEKRLDAFLERLTAVEMPPGMGVVVVRGDETLYLKGFGWADVESKRPAATDTIFYIASSTKSFTGLAAAILAERGDLDLEAPLTRYVPDIRLHESLDAEKISLRDLLTHTHGINNDGPVTFRSAFSGQHTPQLLFDLLHHHGPDSTGREFRYGNIGYNLAGMVMDRALFKSWKDVLADEIFRPLGMESTSAYLSDVDRSRLAMPHAEGPDGFDLLPYTKGDANMHAAGGMVTTVEDLALWLKANLRQGRLGGRQVLSPRAFADAHARHAKEDARYAAFTREAYGLGWHLGHYEEDAFLHHFGGFSGFHAHISFMPDRDLGVAVLTNSAGLGGMIAVAAACYAYDLALGKPDLEQRAKSSIETLQERIPQARQRIAADRSRRAARDQTLPHPLESYAGAYQSPILGRVEFKLADGALRFEMGLLTSDVEVYDNTRNALRVEPAGGGQVVVFEFDEGKDRAARFRFQDLVFERVR